MTLPAGSRWAIGLALLVAAFSAGRFTAPVRVETKTEWRDLSTQELTRGMNFTRVVTRTITKNVVTTITDAGTTITDLSVVREGDDTHAREDTAAKRVDSSTGTAMQTATVRPDWRIGALVGASLKEPALPLTGNLVIGVQVERRIVGGVSVGAWANTVGAAGGVVSVEF